MSNQIRRNHRKDGRKRRPVRLKVRWKEVFIYGPLIVLMLAFGLGPYILDLYEHPDLWNGILLVLGVVFVTVLIWPKLWPKKKSR